MTKLLKVLLICGPGEVYPSQLRAGDECPDYAVKVADQLGILEKPSKSMKAPANKAMKGAPENKGSK